MSYSPSKQQIQRDIRNYCKSFEHVVITPEGKLIEYTRTGYTRIEGLNHEFCSIDFAGPVFKNK